MQRAEGRRAAVPEGSRDRASSHPPALIKKERVRTKADGIFTFVSFRKVNYRLEQVGMAVLSCLLLVVAFINFPRWICC